MPTPQVPKPQLGVDFYAGVIQGLNVADNGVLTVGTSVTFLVTPPSIDNTWRRTNVTDSPGHQEINSSNTRQRNQVVIDDGLTLDLQLWNVNNGNDPSPLTTLWQNYDAFFVTWIEGTVPGAIYTNEFYGTRGDLDKPAEGRGEQLTTAHLLEMDPGAPTIPQYNRYQSG